MSPASLKRDLLHIYVNSTRLLLADSEKIVFANDGELWVLAELIEMLESDYE